MFLGSHDQGRIERRFKRHARIALAAVGTLVIGIFSSAGSAFAQGVSQDDLATQDQPAQAAASQELQEVTVTATRRAESIIQVPISVTAISGGELAAHNLQDFTDFAKLVPNLSYAYSGFSAVTGRSIAIRGIQGRDTTAFYIDDTPVPTSIDPRVLDINRVEVLRGPQGTLFGESSMGGAVRMITNQPDSHNFFAQYMVQGGYTTGAGTPNVGFSGVVNFAAVPDKLAIRIAGFAQHDGGWLKREYLNDPYNPANAGFVLNPLHFPYVGGTSSFGDQGRINEGGLSVSVKWDPATNFSVTARMLYQISKQLGFPVEVGLIATPTQDLTKDPMLLGNLPVRAFPYQPFLEDRWYLPSLDLNYTGPGFSFHSSTSYYERIAFGWESDAEGEAQVARRFDGAAGYNALPLQDHDWENGGKDRRKTQEFRITIDPIPLGFVNLSGVFGYYWSRNYTGPSVYNMTSCNRTVGCQWGSFIGNAAAGNWPNNIDWVVPLAVYEDTDSSWFGQLDFKFFDHLTASVGDRYFHLTQLNPGTTSYIGWTAGIVAATPPEPGINEEVGNSPRFSLTYELNQDASVYATASRGFRAGTARSPNQVLPAFCDADLLALGINPATAGATNPDYLWNYEVGTKFRLAHPNMILSAAVYDIDWTDIQQNIVLPCSYGVGINSGEAKSQGAELEFTINPMPALSLHGAAGHSNAHITTPGAGGGQYVGQPLYLVPQWTAAAGFVYTWQNAANFPMTHASGNPFISADYTYSGERLSDNTSTKYTVTIPHYSMVNARLGMRFENSELSLNVNNVGNTHANLTDYIAQGWSMSVTGTVLGRTPTPLFFVATPRTYMLQYQHHL